MLSYRAPATHLCEVTGAQSIPEQHTAGYQSWAIVGVAHKAETSTNGKSGPAILIPIPTDWEALQIQARVWAPFQDIPPLRCG